MSAEVQAVRPSDRRRKRHFAESRNQARSKVSQAKETHE
jgi:hypothetical protein